MACSLTRFSSRETAELWGILGSDRGDLPFHRRDVGGALELASGAEDEAVLGVEAHHGDLVIEPRAGHGENLPEDLRIQEEGGAEVEPEPSRFDGGGPTADEGHALEEADSLTAGGEEDGGGEPSRTCADDGDLPAHDGWLTGWSVRFPDTRVPSARFTVPCARVLNGLVMFGPVRARRLVTPTWTHGLNGQALYRVPWW